MPRKNHREQYEPADLSNFDGSRPQTRIGDQWTPWSEKAERERRDAQRERQRRQEQARLNRGIDWAVCLVPGCGRDSAQRHRFSDPEWRDHKINLPLCIDHLGTAYAQAKRCSDDPLLVKAVSEVVERDRAKVQTLHEVRKQAALADISGHIYYVRLNDLIKVGWSRYILSRLRAYGLSVEVLVVYPGTRDDETSLHRQLRPALARGHEWYEDGPILADFIARALAQHGPPKVDAGWTKPKKVVAGKRVQRSA